MTEEKNVLKDMMEQIKTASANLDRLRAKLENTASEKIKNIQETEEKLDIFYRNMDELTKITKDLPEFVDKRLEEKMDRHLSRTTDHVFKEFERASQEHLSKLMDVTRACQSAVNQLTVRLGWRDYLPPVLLSLGGFFAAFSVVWYFELGVAKVDIQTIGEASRMRELYYSATPAERKTVSKILYKYLPRR